MDDLAPPGQVPARIPSAAVSWAALYAAVILDVVQVFALVASHGFTDPLLSAAAVTAFVAELYLFSIALRRITPSVANGMLGVATAAVAVISIGWLAEPLTPVKGIALLAVLTGAVLLRTVGTKPASTTCQESAAPPVPTDTSCEDQ